MRRFTLLLLAVLPGIGCAGSVAGRAGRGRATHVVVPGQSIQAVIDASQDGDVVLLQDGVFHETLIIKKAITLRAAHPGETTITNRHPGSATWTEAEAGSGTWYASRVDWPVHRLLVDGVQAFDHRNKENFDGRLCGPFWSKGWQEGKTPCGHAPHYFAHDAATSTLWLHTGDRRDPSTISIDFNGKNLGGQTLVQKDLGTAWNQQDIVVISANPPVHPITHWYDGTRENPGKPRHIDFPRIGGIVIDIRADGVTLEGLRIHMAPTVGVEVNNSKHVTIRDCSFSGYQYAINTGYECTNLTVIHCELDGGSIVSVGLGPNDDGSRADHVTNSMWNHSTYVNPMKFNGTGLTFQHNYVYEGYDLFHPRGRHKDFSHVPNLRSEVSYNVWHNSIDNIAEFDGVEALMNLRFHHNMVLSTHDALAITTTENGGPLTIDHNLWWPGGGRIMKLVGTGRINRGVVFAHNTYFTGATYSANHFEDSVFDNNLVLSQCTGESGRWSVDTLGAFFPSPYNLLQNGQAYTTGFEGLTGDPLLGTVPATRFLLTRGSPAIDAGVVKEGQGQDHVKDGKPDLGALEFGQTIDDWRAAFGHAGPTWITAQNAAQKARNRPRWPGELDPRWGGLN